jgi:hypothetical protein
MNIQRINNYALSNQQKNLQARQNIKDQQAPLTQGNGDTVELTNNSPSFKGKGGIFDAIGKFFSKHYSEPMYNNKTLQNVSEKMSKIDLKADMTVHMAALGSAITSGVYMAKTLENKNLDQDKRRTLAVNQALCFVIPTIGAYTVDHYFQGFIKNNEYRFSGLQSQAQALGKKSADAAKISNRLKHFRPLASLGVFTLIYRFVTPVLITPIANWIGEKINEKVAKKGEGQKENPLESLNKNGKEEENSRAVA